MQSQAKDVASYIQEADADRQAGLLKLRALCLEMLSGYEECMQYGMPVYRKAGIGEVGFANQKQYIALYILKAAVIEKNRPLLQGLNVGKGCIRYTSPKKMNFEVIRQLLADTLRSADTPC